MENAPGDPGVSLPFDVKVAGAERGPVSHDTEAFAARSELFVQLAPARRRAWQSGIDLAPRHRQEGQAMPLILWLLGVPLTIVIVLMLLRVI